MVYAVVTGGGTSGHVVPAMAVLEMLEDAGHGASDLAYVGSRRGVESSMVPALGVRCEYLPISGLQRSFAPRDVLRNAALPVRLLRSTFRARRLLREWNPRVVVSVGGYASEPIARAAVAAGVPLVCVSYDFVPGLATRRQSRRAAVCAVAFDGGTLPRSVVTGAPVRRAVRSIDAAHARRRVRDAFGVADDSLLVTVVGGSLGSAVLNAAVASVVSELAAAGTRAHVHHVCGPSRGAQDDPTPGRHGTVTVGRVAVEADMPGVLAASDIVVSRAGASTVAEIAAIGVASVLVPWSGAAEDHQTMNARWLADDGAALLVDERTEATARITGAVMRLSGDAGLRSALAAAARRKGEPNRSNTLATVIANAALG